MASRGRISRRNRLLEDVRNDGRSVDSRCFEHDDANGMRQHYKRMRNDQDDPNAITNQPMFGFQSSSNDNENTIVGGSSSFGQALYQNSRQRLIVEYEDFGDNIFECEYCGAYFWLYEAKTQRSRNAPIIYTGCCQEGQIAIEQSTPTPEFLEQLLDPKDNKETFFRENIRVYNSMFSFTSMGARVDHSINVGSGPYVFKICGQVHHLGHVYLLEMEWNVME